VPKLDKNSFVAGELTPRAHSRTDLAQYGQGCRLLRNCFVHPHGGVTNRPGTRFAGSVKDPSLPVRLIPFQYSTEAAYIIEAGRYYFRFYVNGGRLDDGGVPVEVVTPWDETDIARLQWAQEADIMYLVHPDWTPRKLSRTTLTTFSLAEVEWNSGRAPLGPFNLDTTNKLAANVAGTTYDRRITMDKSAFVGTDIGRVLYARNTTQKRAAFYLIRQLVSDKIVEADDLHQNPAAQHPTGTDLWALGLFSEGYGCNAVTFHEGRLWFGGFKRQVDGFGGSVVDDFENFEIESPDPDVNDGDNADKAIFRRTVSNRVNAVRSMRSSSDEMVIFTSGAEFRVRGDNEDSLTPTGAVVKFVSGRGSSAVPAVVVDSAIFFLQRSNTAVRKFGIDGNTLELTSRNFSILSDHLLREGGGALALAYQAEPLGMLWLLRRDGGVVSWTYEAEQAVSGPARHVFGGSYMGGPAEVETFAVLEGAAVSNFEPDITGFIGSLTGSITNAGFEFGDTTGWTVDSGTWAASTGTGGTVPYEGSYFLVNSSAVAAEEVHQDFDLTTLLGFNTRLVDNGASTLDFSVWVTKHSATATLEVIIEALDSSGGILGTLYDSGSVAPAVEDTWEEIADTNLVLPALTRQVRFRLIGDAAGACFDTLTAELTQLDTPASTDFSTNQDQLWQVTKRTVNGATVRYVEYLEGLWGEQLGPDGDDEGRRDELDQAFLVDSGLSLNAPLYIESITQANPAVVRTEATHSLSNGDRVRLRHVTGMTEVNQKQFLVANKTALTFELQDLDGVDIDATGYSAFVNTGEAAAYLETQALGGLDHLEGETIALLVDGAVHPNRVVSGGAVTLARWGSIVHAGLPYVCEGETMGAFTSGANGVDIGEPVRISHVTASLVNSIGLEFARGSSPSTYEEIPATPDLMGRSPVPFTGFKTLPLSGRHEDLPSIRFKQELPLPFSLLALYMKYESASD